MKKRLNTTIVLLAIAILGFAQQTKVTTPLQVLQNIALVDSFKVIDSDQFFETTYEVWFRMPIDHNNPNSKNFPLRAYYSHKNFDNPTLVITDGYKMYTSRCHELSSILNSNQITIEHRFFADSRPQDSIPWNYLTIEQAAADEHAVIESFKEFYNKNKWVSTGISKSGQTAIIHKSLYPKDVDVSVPYVAPLNFSNEDTRVYTFLNSVGTHSARKKLREYQIALFENKEKLMPMFAQLAKENNWEFALGLDRVYDLSIFETEFSYWQWGNNESEIPAADANAEELFSYLKKTQPFTFFEDNSIEKNRPFFYQAMTQMGMYGYDIEPFREYVKDTKNITFDFTMPKGHAAIFDPKPMQKVQNWIDNEGNNMLYIYGETDAWSATAVNIGNKTNAVKMVNPNGSHRTRIKSFPTEMQNRIFSILEEWLQIDLSKFKH